MNITRENLSDLEFCIKIDIEESDYTEKVTKKLKQYRQQANVPGFRKGMAPMGMIQRMYKGAVTADEVQNVLNESLYNYIKDEKLDIVGSPIANYEKTPTADFEKESAFTFYFDAALMPKVNIDWSKVDVKHTEIKVEKKEVDRQIESMQNQAGKFETPDELTEECNVYGKVVELDKDGKVKEEGMSCFTSFEVKSIKDDAIRAEFVGKKKEDKVVFAANKAFSAADIEQNFRMDAEAAKKFKSTVELTISGCSHITPHELDEELFNMFYAGKEIKTATDFRKAVTADIEKSYADQSDILYANQVRKQLIEHFDAAIPEAFLKRWILSRDNNKELTAEKLDSEWNENYLPSIKWEFIAAELNKIQSLDPTHDELLEECKNILRSHGAGTGENSEDQEKQLTQMAESVISDSKNTDRMYDQIYHRKLVALLKEQAKPETEKITLKEFETRAKA
ncbi:MAG: trigger factor [Bacteroidales bacterium]|nr:trigger factor [Candidatus Colimorpha onthohippi]